jgi:hypothetical protein
MPASVRNVLSHVSRASAIGRTKSAPPPKPVQPRLLQPARRSLHQSPRGIGLSLRAKVCQRIPAGSHRHDRTN